MIVAITIVRRPGDGAVLLGRRGASKPHIAGLWEFPGGRVEDGEGYAQAAMRELREEVGIDLDLRAPTLVEFVPMRLGAGADTPAEIVVFAAELPDGQTARLADGRSHTELLWVLPWQIDSFDMTRSSRAALDAYTTWRRRRCSTEF